MTSEHIRDASTLTTWRKSSYSGPDNGDCLEVADAVGDLVPVRDSKDAHGPVLLFPAAEWAAFVGAVKGGRFAG